jgi:hypothetical protein
MDQCLVAMLWEVPGYAVDELLPSFKGMGPGVVSTAGGRLARLLMEGGEPQLVERGVLFWERTLEDESLPGEAFHGFGWWAEVKGVDHDRWEQMMLTTCERAGGSVDWATSVAERFAGDRVTRDGLVSTPAENLTPLAGRKLDTSTTGGGSRPRLPSTATGGGRGVLSARLGGGAPALPP